MGSPFGGGPKRAHTLICTVGADTAEGLADELRNMATRLERGEMTVGCIGGPSAGSLYSYRVQPEQTHDEYFRQVDAWLKAQKALAT